jgi:DNA-binding transcriptional LysR family regulator
MNLTLEQARSLDALARAGTFAAAAKSLNKQHSALVYALRGLEAVTGLDLLDRRGYRTRLTPAGERVLDECRRLLAVEQGLEVLCHELKTGWEPRLRLVFDGVFPTERVLREVARVARPSTPTRFEVYAEFLSGVEATFLRLEADLMISVLPPQELRLGAAPLAPVEAVLVVHRDHPLAKRRRQRAADLEAHALLTVRGSDPRLRLSTSGLEQRSSIQLNDFHAKKAAILSGMGFGWLPRELAAPELKAGTLRLVRWEAASEHRFHPHAYHPLERPLGRAARAVVEGLAG